MSNLLTPFKVRSYELDSFGHLNHAVFLNYFEHARFEALSHGGISAAELARRNWGVHVVRIEVDYRTECRLGDLLQASLRIDRFRNSSMILYQSLLKIDGSVAAEARVVVVWIGPDGNPMRIPDEVREALADFEAE